MKPVFTQSATRKNLAGALAAALTLLPMLPAQAQQYAFDRVVVQGNANIDAASILKYAQIQQGAELTAAQLNDALRRISASGLFEKVEFLPEGGVLTIKVVELPIISTLDFQGNKRINDEELATIIMSKARNVFSAATAEADALAIADLYRARGRLAASVEPKIIPRDNGRLDLVFEITEGRVVENESIEFVGNRIFSDRRLRQVLQTKQAGLFRQLIRRDSFDPNRLELDKQSLLDFYRSRGYADVQVMDATAELSRERDATFLVFTLMEGPRYAFGDVKVSSEVAEISPDEYADALRLKSGQVYDPSKIQTNIQRLEQVATRNGLNFVKVEQRVTRNADTQTIDVEFVIQRGERLFVERIDIEGNTTTLDQVVRRQFDTAEGDAFNNSDVRRSAEKIRGLGFFSTAEVQALPGSSPDKVVVNVDLQEAPTGSLSFGVTYGTSSGAGVMLGFAETNLLGRGQALSLNVSATRDTQDYTFGFTEPAVLGRNLKFKLNGQFKNTEEASASYNTGIATISPALEFPINELSRLELRYRLAREGVVNSGSTSTIIIAEAARGQENLSSLGYTLNFDTRKMLDANGGVLLRFGQDFAGVGGDVNYVSSTGLAVAETKVFSEEVTLRAIAEGGVIVPLNGYETRVTDRFFGGGSFRGFERNGIGPREEGDALGGNMFASVRFEAEFPLGLPEEYGILGAAYLDTGSVWGLENGGAAQGVDASLRAAGGLSILWTTPIGPLRMNFSRPIKKEEFDISQSFELTLATSF